MVVVSSAPRVAENSPVTWLVVRAARSVGGRFSSWVVVSRPICVEVSPPICAVVRLARSVVEIALRFVLVSCPNWVLVRFGCNADRVVEFNWASWVAVSPATWLVVRLDRSMEDSPLIAAEESWPTSVGVRTGSSASAAVDVKPAICVEAKPDTAVADNPARVVGSRLFSKAVAMPRSCLDVNCARASGDRALMAVVARAPSCAEPMAEIWVVVNP